MTFLKELIRKTLAARGYELRKIYPPDYTKEFIRIHERVRDCTMTSLSRQHALYEAVGHIEKNNIEGDIVECGVWRGGNAMLSALRLLEGKNTKRTIYLYDTFAGMSEPTEKDVNLHGAHAGKKWLSLQTSSFNEWDYASLEEVEKNVRGVGYPNEKLVFVQGKVEDTIPKTIPEKIALLRLDTDWYESTKHELEHLFPRLVPGGILIIDDYGHWQGARQAVDEYLAKRRKPLFLHRIDYTGRIAVVD